MPYSYRRVRKGEPITADLWNALQDEMKRLGSVGISGGMSMTDGPGGFTFGVSTVGPVTSAVVTTEITARSGDTLGQGLITLRPRGVGPAISDGATAQVVYSNMTVAVPAGTGVEVGPDGEAWKLLAADCPDE